MKTAEQVARAVWLKSCLIRSAMPCNHTAPPPSLTSHTKLPVATLPKQSNAFRGVSYAKLCGQWLRSSDPSCRFSSDDELCRCWTAVYLLSAVCTIHTFPLNDLKAWYIQYGVIFVIIVWCGKDSSVLKHANYEGNLIKQKKKHM